MEIELIINHDGDIQAPVIVDEITLQTEIQSYPGTLKFTVYKDEILDFDEGDAVRLSIDGKIIFCGFVFDKSRNKDIKQIEVTAYDQIKYLTKNSDTYTYTNKTASDVIKMLAEDLGLQTGDIEDTNYRLFDMVEEDTCLYDIIQNALDYTIVNTGMYYILYDDAGYLTLKSLENMQTNLYIDEETAEDFEYKTSIDEQTYNQIKLRYEDEDTGVTKLYIVKDTANINKWGLLQYTDTVEDSEDGITKAETLLKLYNQKTRKLTIQNAFGRIDIRAGSLLYINLNVGDIIVNCPMLVNKCIHTFDGDMHFMELDVIGGEFIA